MLFFLYSTKRYIVQNRIISLPNICSESRIVQFSQQRTLSQQSSKNTILYQIIQSGKSIISSFKHNPIYTKAYIEPYTRVYNNTKKSTNKYSRKTAPWCNPSLAKKHRVTLRRNDVRPVRFRRFSEAHAGKAFPIFRGKSRRESRARCTLAYWNVDFCVQSNVAPRAFRSFSFRYFFF